MFYIFMTMAAIAIVIYLVTSRRTANRVAMLWVIATAIKHEMPLADLIQSQGREARGRSRRLLLDLADTLQEGTTLADAIDRYRILIPEQGRLAIHLGSETGTLDQSLDAALKFIERRPLEVIRNYQIILFYIIVIMSGGMSVTGYIMYFIIPRFKQIFHDFGVELPALTFNLIVVSDFLVNYFYLLPGLLIALILLVFFVGSQATKGLEIPDKAYSASGRYSIFWGILGPFLRLAVRFSPQRASADILRYLSVTAQADHSVLLAVDSLSKHHQAPDIRSRLRSINEQIQQGGSLWDGLASQGFLSRQQTSLLHAAEVAGGLPYALHERSLQFEREHTHRLICFMEYARVAAVLALCLGTSFIVISLFMPLIQLINDLS